METTIPFMGFYNSWHDQEIDQAINHLCDDNETLINHVFMETDFTQIHIDYAEKFTKLFADYFEISVKFKLLSSPKYYNFETDRIIVDISIKELQRIHAIVPYDLLKKRIKERFTSYDGFISFYPNDLAKWPQDLKDWDLNHIGTLIECYILQHENYNQDWELRILEDLNETAINLVGTHMPNRIMKVINYLYERSQRA